jgi:AraC-like DNA-binding protein
MREYIQNLTDNLIARNHYDKVDLKMRGEQNYPNNLVDHIKWDLATGDVRKMNPETLGRIMCSLETGDVMASKKELLVDNLGFAGDCEDLLRELVALCLAFVIRDRLDHSAGFNTTPSYHVQQRKPLTKISIARLNEIDQFITCVVTEAPWGKEPEPLLNLARLMGKFNEWAKKFTEHFKVTQQELETYIALEEYCHHMADGDYIVDDDFPTIEDVAKQVGLSVAAFTQWVNKNVLQYRANEAHNEAERLGAYDD